MTVPRSFTHWTRLEPRPRNGELTDALRAQVRDPLWLLTRQWQLAEFHGDDAGSPVRADAHVDHDHLRRYDLGPRDRGEEGCGPREYAGEPLEALVEREPVLRGEDAPPARLRAEAGQYFLRLLAAYGYDPGDGTPAADDFPGDLLLTEVEGELDADGRAFERVMADRVLDGQAVYDAVARAVSNLAAVGDGASPTVADEAALPLPTDGRRTVAFDSAVVDFVDYYRSLFDEPNAAAPSAWRPERMEYAFAVATGEGEAETVFEAPAFDGGHLDWYAFSVDPDRSLASPADAEGGDDRTEDLGGDGDANYGDDGPQTETTVSTVPTRARFPGMPATRWWEFEDAAVTLGEVAGAGASLPRLLLLEFAVQYGNNWFLVPVETPVGSLSRVTSLSVTDSFGCSQSVEPAVARTDDWNAFAFPLPDADEPGLFVPPTLPTSAESGPVERVVLARDELANLAWGIEHLVEGPVGDPIDRDAFDRPSLRIDDVSPASEGDVATEFVDFENRGDDELDLSGWTVRRVSDGEASTVFTFEDEALPPNGRLRLHTGSQASAAVDGERRDLYCERNDPIWADADALSVTDESDGTPKHVAFERLKRPSDAVADYRLSTDVADHWFPLTVDPTGPTDYRLTLARLIDADHLGVDPAHLPAPQGEILDPDAGLLGDGEDALGLPEEEVTRGGTEVTRRYRLSAWHTGRSHLWTGRRVWTGRGESSSDLRFDVLEERTDSVGSVVKDEEDGDRDREDGDGDQEDGDGDERDGDADRGDGDEDGDRDDEPHPPRETTLGLPETVLAALAYLLGWLSGIAVLLVERESESVRFHAAQSVVVFGALFATRILLLVIEVVVFLLYYPAYPTGFYYPGGPADWSTYLTLSWVIRQLVLVYWLVVAIAWIALVVWTYRGNDPRVPGAARVADALVGRS
ncbi:lamin tail domain-containing protein [Natronococcus wangiae]|uniref:lamin tail domain-containing protein n=1 Tax=Natronococcus wangiae TaxID=3068275 RepID=UPI00273F5C4B|nr:lamin tail domain-containing protein [Natronococcus sp. AD5]